MLPVVVSMQRTTTEIVAHTFALAVIAALFGPVAHMGWIYMIASTALGLGFLLPVVHLWRLARAAEATGPDAMAVFRYSITYLTVLFVAMAADVLIPHHPFS
jgi:heme o synthase